MIPVEIEGADPSGRIFKPNVVKKNGDAGLVVYTDDLKSQSNLFYPALNPTQGGEMAIDASFGGTAIGVHNGTDNAYWTGSAISGTWDFASTTDPDAPSPSLNPGTPSLLCIESVDNTNNTQALFSGSTLDFSNYTAISGRIRIEQWGGASGSKTISFQFRLGGANVGDPVDVDNFLDTGFLNAYQSFAVNKEEFNISGEDVDELVITKSKASGSTPHFRMDNLQIEETGGAVRFRVEPPHGKKFLIKSLYISYVDALNLDRANSSVPALAYDALLGEAALTNGINYQIIEDGEIISSVATKTLGDNLKSGANITSLVCDGTNTCITLEVAFGGPLVLDHRYEDFLDIIIQDDLTGLISFTALASGVLEPVSVHRPEVREG